MLHLKEDASEFMSESSLKDLIHRYSEFITFPIYQMVEKEEEVEVEDEEEEEEEGGADAGEFAGCYDTYVRVEGVSFLWISVILVVLVPFLCVCLYVLSVVYPLRMFLYLFCPGREVYCFFLCFCCVRYRDFCCVCGGGELRCASM